MNTSKAVELKKIRDIQDIIKFYKDFYNRVGNPKKVLFLKQLNKVNRRIKFYKLLLLTSKKITKIYIFKTCFKNMRPKKLKSIIEKLKKDNITVFKKNGNFYVDEYVGHGIRSKKVRNITEARLINILARYKSRNKISNKNTI